MRCFFCRILFIFWLTRFYTPYDSAPVNSSNSLVLYMLRGVFYSCRRFPHPAFPNFLFSHSPLCRSLHSISVCIFSLQALLGLPLFLLQFGTQFNILLGHRSSGILWTCPYHINLFIFIVSIMSFPLCTLVLISSFRMCSNLDTPQARLQ